MYSRHYFFVGAGFYSTTDIKFQIDKTVKTEQSQIENYEEKKSWDYLELQEMSGDANIDVKLEVECCQTIYVKFQTGETVKTEYSQFETHEDQKIWDHEKLQEMSEYANVDIKSEGDCRSLDSKVELPEIQLKSEIVDMQVDEVKLLMKNAVEIGENM